MNKTPSANTNLSHYQIVSKIGAGGMGEVFLATDSKLKRKVALKLLPAEFTDDKQRLRRFEQEAQTASALNHPNIITIYEIGVEAGLNFIATEFIEGQTLRQKMRQALLPLNETLDIAQQVTSALVAAHQAGIVHRDLKPENIMVRPDGLVKVLDFGLAKMFAPASALIGDEADTFVQGMTQPGMILGTLHYMSPEQVRGLPVDARSDIFSWAAVIYEMLTGRGPFSKPTKGDVIAAILTENTPPASQLNQEVPPELQRILAKALQKDKEDRYQTSKDLLVDIKSVCRELELTGNQGRMTRQITEATTNTTSVVTARRFSVVHALVMLLAVGLTFGALWWFVARRNPQADTPSPASLKTAEVLSWRSTPGEVYSTGSFSPDGLKVALVSTASGTRNIQVKQTSANAPPVQTTKDEFNNERPIWSPDGEEIAFFSNRGNQQGIWRIPYLGGSPALITTVPDGATRPRFWSRTGRLYYQANHNLFALDLKSGQTSQLTSFDTATAVTSISISPDEKQIAYAAEKELWLAPARGGAPRPIVKGGAEIRNIVWHPDSRRVLYSAQVDGTFQICVTDIDGNKPVPITFGDRDSLALDVSADGSKILYGSSKEESDVWGVNVAKAEEFALTSDLNAELWPSVSPDGRTVAFQSIRNLSQGDKLFSGAIIMTKAADADAPPTQLVANGFLPTWSPDGKQLAFMRLGDNAVNLWTVKAAGGTEKQLTTCGLPAIQNTVLPYNRVQTSYFSWSPDSSRIAYLADKTGAGNVWLVSAVGAGDTQLTNNSDANLLLNSPLWSPDGKRVAYTAKQNKPVDGKLSYGVWVVEVETKVTTQVLQTETFLRLLGWSEDGKGLVLATVKGKGALLSEVDLVQISLGSGVRRVITTQPTTYLYNIHLSPDRRLIAFVSQQDGKDNIWIIPAGAGAAKKLTANKDARLYFSSLAWSPDGRTIFFGKQSRYSLLSMITNFK